MRSLSGPGRRTARAKSRIVGAASRANGRSSSKSGISLSRTIGRASSTSGSRTSSAERRLTNVVFPLRRNCGNSPTPSVSAARREASASVVVAMLEISEASSSSRAARSVTSVEVAVMKRSKSGVLRLSSANRRLDVESAGFSRRRAWLASSVAPALKSRSRRMVPPTALRVVGSNVSKSWSRSIAEAVSCARDLAAVCDLFAVGAPEVAGRCSGWRRPTARSGGRSRAYRAAAARSRRR